jgi:hypothetical protein
VTNCPECAQAEHGPWRTYKPTCPECFIRCIANTDSANRTAQYDKIEAEVGRRTMLAIKEKVGLEIVRMRLLREGAKT